jgi:hypothetical protein
VESLYQDQLKPYGRLLRKRLTERGAADGLLSSDTGLSHLHSICARSPWLHIQPAQGGEWIALLVHANDDFVDVYSPVDVYPSSLWQTAAEYFEALTDEEAKLPGGRFSCAECLVARRLPFLEGYSLGKVAHFVQLAISQKKILGYGPGSILPYARSQSRVKDEAAQRRILLAATDDAQELPLATWEDVRCNMNEILELHSGPGEPVPLSGIKRIFRVTYNRELSETALGHAKLSELLQDSRLNGICTVRLLDTGYFVIPTPLKDPQEESTHASQSSIDLDSCDRTPCAQDEDCDWTPGEWVVHNTFLHAQRLHRHPVRRSRSAEAKLRQTTRPCVWANHPETGTNVSSLPEEFRSLGFVVHNTFIDVAPASSLSQMSPRSTSVPRSQ